MSENDQVSGQPDTTDAAVPAGGASAPGGCQFPGCDRPVPVAPGKGRPARYCGQMVLGTLHNRANALTRRRQLERAGVDADRAVGEPVTVARATAGDLVGRIETVVREFNTLQSGLVAALQVMDSPEQAAAQVAATAETARAEIATARAEAAAAQRRAEQADATAAQALADAEDADADAATAREDADQAREIAAAAVTARTEADEQLGRTRAELAAQLEATAQQMDRSERAEARAGQLDADLTGVRAELAQVRADAATAAAAAATRAENDAATIVGQREELAAAAAAIEDLRTDLAAQVEATGAQTVRAEQAER
jgi:colicin import membrane protein